MTLIRGSAPVPLG